MHLPSSSRSSILTGVAASGHFPLVVFHLRRNSTCMSRYFIACGELPRVVSGHTLGLQWLPAVFTLCLPCGLCSVGVAGRFCRITTSVCLKVDDESVALDGSPSVLGALVSFPEALSIFCRA